MSTPGWRRMLLFGWLTSAILLASCSTLPGLGATPTPEPPLFRYDTAIATAEAEQDPAHQAAAYLARGDAQADQNHYEQALADYTIAISHDPTSARAYNNRALVYQALMQYQAALVDLTAALQIDPTYVRAYKNRVALLEQSNGDQSQLAVDYGHLAELEPTNAAEYRYRQGSALHGLRDFAGARAAYDAALAANPQQIDALYERALLSYAEGQHSEALADLDRAIKLSPRAANAYYARGMVLNAIGDTAGALSDFTQTLALEPNNAEALLARAAVYNATGDTTNAIADLDRLDQLTISEDLKIAATTLRRILKK